MKRFVPIIVVVLMTVGTALSFEIKEKDNGGPPAGLQFKAAYQFLVKADEARDADKLVEARGLYRKAVEAYARLTKKYPDWQRAVVRFRIAYCANQYESIANKIGKEPITPPESVKRTPVKQPVKVQKRPVRRQPPPVVVIPPKGIKTPPKNTRSITDINKEAKKLLVKGSLEGARAELLKGLELSPDDKDVRVLLSIVQCRKGEFEDAMSLLIELVDEDGKNPLTRVLLGTAYFGLGKTEDAGRQMKLALELDPVMPEAHYNMARIILETKPVSTPLARYHYKTSLDLGGKRDKTMDYLLK